MLKCLTMQLILSGVIAATLSKSFLQICPVTPPLSCASRREPAAKSCRGRSGCSRVAAMLSQKPTMLLCRWSLVALLVTACDNSPSSTARAWRLALHAPAVSAGSGELHVTPEM